MRGPKDALTRLQRSFEAFGFLGRGIVSRYAANQDVRVTVMRPRLPVA